MRSALRLAGILGIGLGLVAGLEGAGGAEPARDAAPGGLAATAKSASIAFNSEIGLVVWTIKNGEYTVVGQTPAARPLVIPDGAEWGVTPLEDATETALQVARRRLQQKMGRQLSLQSWAHKDEEFAFCEEGHAPRPLTIPEGVHWAVTVLADRRIEMLWNRPLELDYGYTLRRSSRSFDGCWTQTQAITTGMVDLFGTMATDAEIEQNLPSTSSPLFWMVGPFAKRRDLSRLNLGCTRVTDEGLAELQEIVGLQAVNLYGTRVTDAGLAHLKELPNLQNLDLEATQVTDAGLVCLGGMHGLRALSLAQTGVTDAELIQLEDLHGLRTLSLRGTKVTRLGIRKLQGALPDCFIQDW